MLVYRLVSHAYASDISGTGAGLYGGRWNPAGTPILYTTQHRSLALCEMMVHLDKIQIQQDFDILTINIPDRLVIKKLNKNRLPKNWNNRMINPETTTIGRKFALDNKYVGLEVPSVVIPEESNFLFNPIHDDFGKIKIVERKKFIFDERLF